MAPRKTVWFGTQEYMTWVPAPAVNVTRNSNPWTSTVQYLNGGAAVVRTATGAHSFSFSWNPMSSSDMDVLQGMFDGVYGTGGYWYADPFTFDSVLPSWLAAPHLNADELEGPGFRSPYFTNGVTRAVADPSNGRPPFAAVYPASTDTASIYTHYIPVPPGMYLHFGAGFTGDTTRMKVNGEAVTPITDNALTNWHMQAGATGALVPVMLDAGDEVTVQWAHAFISSSAAERTGPFRPGRGHGKFQLTDQPQVTQYSAALASGNQSISVSLMEVGPWEKPAA